VKVASKSHWDLLVASVPMLREFVRRHVAGSEAADEILQEVSLRILTSEGPSDCHHFLAWSRAIARYVLVRDYRMRKRAGTELPLDDESASEVCRHVTDPEGDVDARTGVARVIGALDSEGIELLVRRHVLEQTGKELADELAQSPAAMRMRLMRLRSTARVARTRREPPLSQPEAVDSPPSGSRTRSGRGGSRSIGR